MENNKKDRKNDRNNKREFVKKSPYEEKVISIGRVSKTTKGGRTMRFTATVAVGDRKGKVGLGTGKASEVPTAISKAIKAAEKNVISINLVEGRTLSHEAIGKCGAAKVLVKPAKAGSGIIAGGPVRNVLELAGVKDIVSKSLGSNTQINTAKAAMDALKQQKSASHIASLRGKTVEEIIG
ncbi:30S ribosomal protein S5 [Clostridium sp. CAG:628]|jgi:small subunit ribosomal protein S5|nr:30S ribosomal protein S5 [Clostridium sp. CAG:628]